MSCRRWLEIEIPEFLAEPGAPRFADFRDHYPRCRACSAEVRAWSELHARLAAAAGSAHPDPETWVRYAQTPGALASDARRALERHLAGCAACRDELAGLARFSPAALVAPPEPDAAASRLRAALASLSRVVLHPAFAYALVALLLLPLARNRGPLRPGGSESGRRQSTPAEEAREEDRAPAPPATEFAAGTRLERAAEVDALQQQASEARRARARARADAPAPAQAAATPAPAAIVSFDPGQPMRLPAFVGDGDVVLRLPLPEHVGPVARFEVRVVDPGRSRELRETRAAEVPRARAGAGSAIGGETARDEAQRPVAGVSAPRTPSWVSSRVPRRWLSPGSYRVELRTSPGEGEPIARFDLEVGGP